MTLKDVLSIITIDNNNYINIWCQNKDKIEHVDGSFNTNTDILIKYYGDLIVEKIDLKPVPEIKLEHCVDINLYVKPNNRK